MSSPVLARCVAAFSASLLLSASNALAQTPAPVPPPQPAAASAPRPTLPAAVSGYLEGRWAGTGTFTRTGKPLSSVYEFVRVLNGEALEVRHAEDAPLIFAWQGVISLDTVSQDIVLLLASNQAGGARLMRSKGWQDEKLVFEASADLRAWFAFERLTFEKLGDHRFRATYEVSRDGVAWASGDVQTFERVDPAAQA